MSLLSTACSVFGVRDLETPGHEVLLSEDGKEVRAYSSYLVARTTVEGSYEESGDKAFQRLFGYISGKNRTTGEKIDMTAPVLQEKRGGKIEMTAPVTRERGESGWIMAFVLPSVYDLQSAPEPADPKVELAQVPPRTMAVLRYTGFTSAEKIARLGEELEAWAQDKGYEPVSGPVSARYDPPWTIPFLRRNEVLLEVKRK